MKNYYKVLGLSDNATKDEIKKAFRFLAKRYHPDINSGNKAAEEKFKEVSEAYEVLGNEENKAKYDNARVFGNSFNFNGFSSNGPFGSFYKAYQRTKASEGSDIFSELLKSFNLGNGHLGGLGEVFGNVFSKAKKFTSGQSGTFGAEANLRIPLKTALLGGTVEISGLPGGKRQINIQPNTANNTVLNVGSYSVRIDIEDDPHFKVIGNNIKAILTINIAQAILGSKVKFIDPRGTPLILVVPKGTKQGDRVKLTSLGLPGGDLYVEFDIAMPERLTEELCLIFSEAARKIGWKY